jgi:RepB DNA-primase N-terminal domain
MSPQPEAVDRSLAPADAVRMVKLLAGDAGSVECFHALRKGPRKAARHVFGAINDPETASRLLALNADGYDMYITAHLIRPGLKKRFPTDEDIEEGRTLFIDSDGAPRPQRWHMPPDFTLEREDDPTHNWWAFWIIDGSCPFPPEDITRFQKRIAAYYGTDASVCDRRRIVRLPGYIRHKANEGPAKKNKAQADTTYRLVERPGQ